MTTPKANPSITVLRDTLSELTSQNIETVVAALDNGRCYFLDAPYSLMEVWTLDSHLADWETKDPTTLSAEDLATMLNHIALGWQSVGAMLHGGLKI